MGSRLVDNGVLGEARPLQEALHINFWPEWNEIIWAARPSFCRPHCYGLDLTLVHGVVDDAEKVDDESNGWVWILRTGTDSHLRLELGSNLVKSLDLWVVH